MSVLDKQQSILSAMPSDSLNIIKDFLVEERQSFPLKLKDGFVYNFFITKYKNGYQIKKCISKKRFESSHYNSYNDERKKETLKKLQKKIDKYYPVYIDDKDDLVNYMFQEYYGQQSQEDPEDSDYDEENNIVVVVKIGGINSVVTLKSFKVQMSVFVKLLGKVYKKI